MSLTPPLREAVRGSGREKDEPGISLSVNKVFQSEDMCKAFRGFTFSLVALVSVRGRSVWRVGDTLDSDESSCQESTTYDRR